jgi:hypothetical protein
MRYVDERRSNPRQYCQSAVDPGAHQPAAVLAPVKDALRRLRRSPVANTCRFQCCYYTYPNGWLCQS